MHNKIMVALDVNNKAQALAMRDTLADSVGWLKVGLRLFVAEGPSLISDLTQTHKVFFRPEISRHSQHCGTSD